MNSRTEGWLKLMPVQDCVFDASYPPIWSTPYSRASIVEQNPY